MTQENTDLHDIFSAIFGGIRVEPWPTCGIYGYGHACRPGVAYILRCGDLYKIGYSSLGSGVKTLEGRINFISVNLQIPFVFEHAIWANCGRGLEAYLHKRYSKFRFAVQYQRNLGINESQEIFRLGANDLAWILGLETYNNGAVTHFGSLAEIQQFVTSAVSA